MNKRFGFGFGVCLVGALTMMSGCATPEGRGSSESDGELETVSQPMNTATTCAYADYAPTGGKKEAHKRATKALKYILGQNNVGEATCDSAVKNPLNVIRAAIWNGTLYKVSSGSSLICEDQVANRIRYEHVTLTSTKTPGTDPVWAAINTLTPSNMQNPLDICFGRGASTFFVLQTNSTKQSNGQYRNWVEFDPELASLSGPLGTGTGSSATASWSEGGSAKVYRFDKLGASCGSSGAKGGDPCAQPADSVNPGDKISRNILTNSSGTTCACR